VAHSVHSVLVVASTFGFEGWDLYIPYVENVVFKGILGPATWLNPCYW
jgi:hypothetical protein